MPETTTATWPALTAGAKARASDVEAKFDWLEGHLWPQVGGTTTTGVFDLGGDGKSWRSLWATSINPTTTAGGVAMFTTTVANASVGFEIAGSKAFLVPRLTSAQRTGLTALNGMLVYDTDNVAFYIYENGAWVTMGQKLGIMASGQTQTTSGVTSTVTVTGSGRINGLSFLGNGGGVHIRVTVDSVTTGWVAGTATGSYIEREFGNTSGTLKVSTGTPTANADIFFKNQFKIDYVSSGGFTTAVSYQYELA